MAAFVKRNSDWNFCRILMTMAPKTKFRPEKLRITKIKSKKIDGADNNLSDTYSSKYPLGTLLEKQTVESMWNLHYQPKYIKFLSPPPSPFGSAIPGCDLWIFVIEYLNIFFRLWSWAKRSSKNFTSCRSKQ